MCSLESVSDSDLVDSASSQISGAESLSPDNEDEEDSGELWISSVKQKLPVANGMSFGESNLRLSEKANVLSDSDLDVSFLHYRLGNICVVAVGDGNMQYRQVTGYSESKQIWFCGTYSALFLKIV